MAPVSGNERGNDGCKHCHQNHQRGVNPCKSCNKTVNFRLGGGCIFHAVQNSGHHGLGQLFLHPDGQLAHCVHAAGSDAAAGLYAHRHRLAGNGRCINAAFAGNDGSVQRNPVAGPDQQQIPDFSILGRNHLDITAFYQIDHLRPQIHCIHDLTAAALHGPGFKVFADPVEEHDADSLTVFSDKESADGGHCHQEVFIQGIAFQKSQNGFPNHAQTQDRIGCHTKCQCQRGISQTLCHKADYKQSRTQENTVQAFPLFQLSSGPAGLGCPCIPAGRT